MSKTNEKQDVEKMRESLIEIGDRAHKQYNKSDNIDVAKTAINAYDKAIKAVHVGIMLKRINGE